MTGFSSTGTRASSIEYNTFSVNTDGEIAAGDIHGVGGGGGGGGGGDGKTDTDTRSGTTINSNDKNNLIIPPTDQEGTMALSVSPPPTPPTKTFGDHILEKWRGVYVN